MLVEKSEYLREAGSKEGGVMKGVNLGRVILGGLVAGIVVNISEFLLNGVVLKKDYEIIMKSMNKPTEMTALQGTVWIVYCLSLIHISEPTRLGMISYAVFCLKK